MDGGQVGICTLICLFTLPTQITWNVCQDAEYNTVIDIGIPATSDSRNC